MPKFDVVIIGSGIGGLVAGAILSKEGYHVCVLEKNRQIGGSLQTFARNKRVLDTGVHYVGGLSPGQNLHTLFKYLGIIDDLKLKQLDEECFDVITFDSDPRHYQLAQGYDRFVETLCTHFPSERKNLLRYCDEMQKLCANFPMYNLEAARFDQIETKYITTGIRDFLKSIIDNVKLQNVLAGNSILYAGQPESTPVYIHALIMNSYILGSWKFIDGGSQLSLRLGKLIRENGGQVIRNCPVVQFGFTGDRLSHVETSLGEKIQADYFISNIHPAQTVEMIEAGKVRNAYKKRLQCLPNTISSFNVYMTFKDNEFPYINHNFYHHKSENAWQAINYEESRWPESVMFCTPVSKKTDRFAKSGAAICYMRYQEMAKWNTSFNTVAQPDERGKSYEDFKMRKSETVINYLSTQHPGLKSAVSAHFASTPLTYRDYIGNTDGSLYGIVRDSRDPLKAHISPRTKIPNLYLVGQNVHMGHGVLGVTIGAFLTASELLGLEYLVSKVRGS